MGPFSPRVALFFCLSLAPTLVRAIRKTAVWAMIPVSAFSLFGSIMSFANQVWEPRV
jgi:hypothetical protein